METAVEYQNIRALVSTLDFQELARLEQKPLEELTEAELKYIGLNRFGEIDGEYYFCKDMHGVKIYFERQGRALELKCPGMKGLTTIRNSGQLILEALFKWRLKNFGMQAVYS